MATLPFRSALFLYVTIGLTFLMSVGSPAHAQGGRVNGARVAELSVTVDLAWVRFDANIVGARPSCIAAGWSNELMFDPTTDSGKAFLGHLEVAMSAGKKVDAHGANACFGDAEALSYVKVYR